MPVILEGVPGPVPASLAIVVSRFNHAVTARLLDGALKTLADHGVESDRIVVVWVPGAWEIPVAARRLAERQTYAAILCLGAIIRGQTSHDQFIADQLSYSLGRIALDSQVPVLCGVLTCETLEQALQRSGGSMGNQGSHCARAALEMVDVMAKIAAHPP